MSTRKVKRRRISAPTGQFDLVVIGSGGGNDETNLSGYLCKPRDQPWDAGILGLEAGSGYGALKRLLATSHPHLFASLDPDGSKLSPTDRAYAVYTHLKAYLLTHAHLDHAASLVISAGSLPGPTKHILGAQGVLDDLYRCIFSPGRCWPNIVGWEGGHGGKLRALPISDEYAPLGIDMNDVRIRVVPVSHGGSCNDDDDGVGIYRSSAFFVRHVPTQHEFLFFGDVEADPDLDVSAPSPPHSTPTLTPASTLDSLPVDPPALTLADAHIKGFPEGGLNDVHVSGGSHPCSRPLLFPIWQRTAQLFVSSNLHTILLECSWPAGRPVAQLFGHLGVEQVRKEMRILAAEVAKVRQAQTVLVAKPRLRRAKSASPPAPPPATRSLKRKATHLSLQPAVPPSPCSGALKGLRVLVIHCKEPSPGFDLAGAPTIADYIVRQLNEGVPGTDLGPNDLGVEYIAAHQGDEFVL